MVISWRTASILTVGALALAVGGDFIGKSHVRADVAEQVPTGKGAPELVLQYTESAHPVDLAFAARAPVFAASSESGRIDIWSTRNWTLERSIDTAAAVTQRSYNTKGTALSPDGNHVAYITGAGEVQLWDTRSGSLLKKLPEPIGLPVSLRWSPDGSRIAAGSTEKVRLWDVTSGSVIRSFAAAGDVAFSANGRLLATAGEDDARLFDLIFGKLIRSFADKAGVSGPVDISPDGRYVATGGEDPDWDPGPLPRDESGDEFAPSEAFYAHERKVKIWDARTGKLIRMLPGHHNLDGGTITVQFAPDSRRIFCAGSYSATIWDLSTGLELRSFSMYGPVAMSTYGGVIACGGDKITVYDAQTGNASATLAEPPMAVVALSFSPDGRQLAAGSQRASTSLRLWDLREGKLLRSLAGPPADLQNVGFIGGNQVFSNSFNGIYIWNKTTGSLIRKHNGPVIRNEMGPHQGWALMTPDGSRIVSESQDGSIFSDGFVVRDRRDGRQLSTIPNAGRWMDGASISPNGRFMITRKHSVRGGSPSDTLSVWNLETGSKVSELAEPAYSAMEVAFSPDSSTIAGVVWSRDRAPSTDNTIRIVLWDLESGRVLSERSLGADRAVVPVFSVNGRTLAVAVGEGIRFYDARSLEETGSVRVGAAVQSIAFSGRGDRLAAGSEDGMVRLWELPSRKLLITFLGFSAVDGADVSGEWLAWTPDGFYNWSPGAARYFRWRSKGQLYSADAFSAQLRSARLLR